MNIAATKAYADKLASERVTVTYQPSSYYPIWFYMNHPVTQTSIWEWREVTCMFCGTPGYSICESCGEEADNAWKERDEQ